MLRTQVRGRSKCPFCTFNKDKVDPQSSALCFMFFWKFVQLDGSVGWASGFHAGGCEFDSGRTNTQGLKIDFLVSKENK